MCVYVYIYIYLRVCMYMQFICIYVHVLEGFTIRAYKQDVSAWLKEHHKIQPRLRREVARPSEVLRNDVADLRYRPSH